MKSVFLKKIAEQQAKKTATKEITTEQFKKFKKQKKEISDKFKSISDFSKNKGKFNIIERKFGEAIGDKNLSKANKALDEMKDFVKNIKDKPIQQTKKVRKRFATIEEARQAAKDAGKKTFNFGGKTEIPVTRVREKKGKLADMTKGMSKEKQKLKM